MQTKTKILFIVTAMLLALGLATTINVALNFRDYSIKNAVEKAQMTASIVENGLTAHMINNTMDTKSYFLNSISQNDDIKSLWLVRSKGVIDQYGAGLNNETVRDSIDENVLSSGTTIKKIFENTNEILLRVTIPYKAESKSTTVSCLDCHAVQRGDTLGAISMEFDITDSRTDGLFTIIKILGINLIFLFIVLILLNKYLTPYTQLFSNMREGVTKAYRGDFSHKFKIFGVTGEARELVEQMNSLFEKMQEAFGNIKVTLSTFVSHSQSIAHDPLHETKTIINELADIYKFKKTIELDISKEIIYNRIINVLKNKYHIHNFALYEVNSTQETRNLVYITQGKSICFDSADKDATNCRAYRTKSDVISTDFSELCQACEISDIKYICLPFTINKDSSLVLSITTKDKEELNHINMNIANIRNYFEAAKPVIESRLLMDQLRDTSLRDGMTGLYNRRFLEEFIDTVMSQTQREDKTYSVLMLDVDFFKIVNDTYGHDVGDKVIVKIGELLHESIRTSDLAIRYGGEEFILMLHNANEEGTLKVAQAIHKKFSQIIFNVADGKTMQKTMSIGISYFPKDADTILKCIKFADNALYKAKTTGRNKIVSYTKDMLEDENIR